MFNIIKIEMDRAFRNTKMYLALFIGCMVSVAHVLIEVVPVLKYQEKDNFTMFPHTSYEHYMGTSAQMISLYFYMLAIILAAVPYATTAYTDRKTGYIKNIFTRTEKKNYYIAKYITAFLSAGVVAVVPQILDFIIVSLILPTIQPYPGIGYVGLFMENMWSEIYYDNAFIYIVMYWVLDFVIYGLINTISISAMWLVSGKIVFLLLPFIVTKCTDLVFEVAGVDNWQAQSFVRPCQPYVHTSFTVIVTYAFVLILICIVSGIYGVKKKDNIV